MNRLAAVVFWYEGLAMVTPLPSLTHLSRNRPWLKALLMVLLGGHLYKPYWINGARP